jgi:hypothetical protein
LKRISLSRLRSTAAVLATAAAGTALAAAAAPAASAAPVQAGTSAHQHHVHHLSHLHHLRALHTAHLNHAQRAEHSIPGHGAEQAAPVAAVASGDPRAIARAIVPAGQWAAFDQIISHESGWNPQAVNASSGAYGLGQALPGSKMAAAGSDWKTNPATQAAWALNYMNDRYGSPDAAWDFWQTHHWY